MNLTLFVLRILGLLKSRGQIASLPQ